MTYRKKLNSTELTILNEIKDFDITAPFNIVGKTMKIEKYTTTLAEYMDTQNISADNLPRSITDQIDSLITTLHGKDILHGDLHAENIIYDKNKIGREIRLIDFGESKHISKLNKVDISYYNKFWEPEVSFTTIQDIIYYEKTMWKIGY